MAKTRKRNDSASDSDIDSTDSQEQVSSLNEGRAGDHRDRIAMRAYELYLSRGSEDGRDFDDWLAAEREVGGGAGNASKGDAGE